MVPFLDVICKTGRKEPADNDKCLGDYDVDRLQAALEHGRVRRHSGDPDTSR